MFYHHTDLRWDFKLFPRVVNLVRCADFITIFSLSPLARGLSSSRVLYERVRPGKYYLHCLPPSSKLSICAFRLWKIKVLGKSHARCGNFPHNFALNRCVAQHQLHDLFVASLGIIIKQIFVTVKWKSESLLANSYQYWFNTKCFNDQRSCQSLFIYIELATYNSDEVDLCHDLSNVTCIQAECDNFYGGGTLSFVW